MKNIYMYICTVIFTISISVLAYGSYLNAISSREIALAETMKMYDFLQSEYKMLIAAGFSHQEIMEHLYTWERGQETSPENDVSKN